MLFRSRIDVIAEVLKLDPSKANDVLPSGWDDNGSEELACNIMRLAIHYGARFENASAWNLPRQPGTSLFSLRSHLSKWEQMARPEILADH